MNRLVKFKESLWSWVAHCSHNVSHNPLGDAIAHAIRLVTESNIIGCSDGLKHCGIESFLNKDNLINVWFKLGDRHACGKYVLISPTVVVAHLFHFEKKMEEGGVIRGYEIPMLDKTFVVKVCPFPAGTRYTVHELWFDDFGNGIKWTHFHCWEDGRFTGIHGEWARDGMWSLDLPEKVDATHDERAMSTPRCCFVWWLLAKQLGFPPEIARMIIIYSLPTKRFVAFIKNE